MRKNKKYPLGGLLTAAQLIEPMIQDKLEQITAAPVVPDMTYNSSPYGKMKNGGSIHIDPANKGKFTETKRRTGKTTEELTHSKNPLTRKRAIFAQNAAKWKHPDGGILPNEFTQYSAPDHAQGGQTVDANGNPSTTKPVAEIQNNENTFKNYVYSDELTNPKTGNKFNIDMQKLVKKYKGSDMDMIKKAGLNVEAENLSKTNDVVRSVSEAIDSAMPQAPNGIDLEPLPQLPINIVPGQVNIPQVNNMNLPHIQNPFETMIGQDVQDPFDSYTKAPTYINKVMSNRFSSPFKAPSSSLSDAPPDYSSVTNTDDASGIPEKKPFNYNIPALVAKGLGFAGSVANALKPAQKERLILPDYQDADNSFNRASIDYTTAEQDALGASNYLSNMNRGTSSGFQQFRNREQARIADLQDKLSGINMAERNTNSQLDVTRGQYRAGKAQDIANRTYQNQVDNLQNEAAKQQFNDQMFSELTQIGSSFNQYQGFREELANRKDIANLSLKEFITLSKSRGLQFTLPEAKQFLEMIQSGQNPIQFTK